jgi:hypothetical protein
MRHFDIHQVEHLRHLAAIAYHRYLEYLAHHRR